MKDGKEPAAKAGPGGTGGGCFPSHRFTHGASCPGRREQTRGWTCVPPQVTQNRAVCGRSSGRTAAQSVNLGKGT